MSRTIGRINPPLQQLCVGAAKRCNTIVGPNLFGHGSRYRAIKSFLRGIIPPRARFRRPLGAWHLPADGLRFGTVKLIQQFVAPFGPLDRQRSTGDKIEVTGGGYIPKPCESL